MRHFITLILLLCTLTLQAQQTRKTPAKPATKAVTTQKQAPAKKSAPAKQQKAAPAKTKQKTPAKQATPTTKDIQKLKKEQESLQRKIKESETMIRNTKDNVSAQLSNLAVITGHIASQREYVEGIQQEVDTLTHNIGALGKDIMFLEEDLEECKKKYAHGLMYMYRTRLTQSKLMFIFSAKTFSQMYRRIRYAQEYTKYQRAQAIVIQKKEEEIRKKREELEQTNIRKTGLLKEGKEQQRELEKQQKERQEVVNELNKKQKQLQATLQTQRQQSQQLNNRIDQLIQQELRRAEEQRKAEEARRKAAEARKKAEAERQKAETERQKAEAERQKREQATAKSKKNSGKKQNAAAPTDDTSSPKGKQQGKSETPSNPAPSTPRYNAPDNVDRQLSSNFAANQGRLPVPITGSYVISAHYGPYSPEGLEGVTLDNKGTDYTGKAGAQARSIFDGEVTSVFNLGGMTNIIVRHGSYISVYCNLSSANVRPGQRVSTRQILGSVARDASGNCTLHFQLRKETSKLNPESWIGR